VLFGGSTDDWMSEEFEQIPDDDEDDESQTASTTEKSETPSKQIRTYTALPAWLSQDYADTRERLLGEMKKNVSRKPSCYDKGTFMDSSSYPFFVAAKKFQLQPEHFYKPKYFVFIPHLLAGRPIRCPHCLSRSEKGKNGQPVCLTPNGFPKAPRRVVDLDENIYIIGYRYKCQNCRKTYQSWSPALLNVMPRTVAQQFTHHLTYRGGLTDRVVSLMRGCFLQGMGPNPFAQMIRTNHIRHYEQLHLQYLEFIYARHEAPLHYTGQFKPFSSFNNREGYAGHTPSGHYFRNFYVKFMAFHAGKIDQYTAMLPANIIQIDHSFKVRGEKYNHYSII